MANFSKLYDLTKNLPGLKYILLSNRYLTLRKWFYRENLKILDVGCGNLSVISIKRNFPWVRYFGIDRDDPEIPKEDPGLMEQYYKKDLDKDNLNNIPNAFFDIIMCSHVIEHLKYGESLIEQLYFKLKRRGILYIESPSLKSINFPSMEGTLNFYDDKTHIRLYDMKQLTIFIESLGFITIKSGTYRKIIKILTIPLNIIVSLILHRKIIASCFWDLFGFVNYGVYMKMRS